MEKAKSDKMNKKTINKSKAKIIFLTIIIFSVSFIIFPRNAKADDPTISAYNMVTNDITPLIKGTSIGLPDGTVVSVNIGGFIYTSSISAGAWSVEFGHELDSGYYYEATITASTASDSCLVFVDESYPYEFYYTSEGDEFEFSSVTFSEEYAYDSEDGNFSLLFPAGTVVTKTGGGTFDISEWYAETVDANNERIISKLRFGVPDIDLTFSHDVTVTFHVGAEYNGENLNIFSRGDGANDEGWDPLDIDCIVGSGSCSFDISHASYFAISQYTSIAETEEEEMDDNDDDSDDAEKAKVSSWKAYQYEKPDTDCPERLKLKIKGKHFNKGAEVRIGNKKAFSVNRKTSREITAKFCLEKLLDIKTGLKRTISVTNPDAEKGKADKKINLGNVKHEYNESDFDYQTANGAKNIQRALSQLGLLDQQYITGFYGSITTEAIKRFQDQNGLSNKGYFGPLTKAKLAERLQ